MWVYIQKTGEIFHDALFTALGYSGNGAWKNDPAAQGVHNHGPLPCGMYLMEPPRDDPHVGPYAIPLKPNMDNHMYGRSAFYWHGDSIAHPGDASDGCIVSARDIREAAWNSGDHYLKVIAEEAIPA